MNYAAKPSFNSDDFYQYASRELRNLCVDLRDTKHYPAWHWSFLCEAAQIAYQRTREERHLLLLGEAVNHAFRFRDIDREITDEQRQRVLNGWGHVRDDRWTNLVARAGRILIPTLDYVKLCKAEGRENPQNLVDKCAAAVEDFVDEFVVSLDGEEGLFRRPFRGDWEPLNHSVSMGRALLRLGPISGDPRFTRMARQLATFFKRSLVLENGGRYAWAYRPNLKNRMRGFPTPFWKADIDLSFVVDCVRQGVVFDEDDIARFVASFKSSVIRPEFLNCRVSVEKPVPIQEKAAKIGSRIYGLCGWMVLSPFDDEIEGLIEDAMERHADLMPGGWFGVPRAALGYTFKRA